MNEKNQKIKCNVESCMFQNSSFCTLEEIQVGNSETREAIAVDETACKSFKFDNK